MEMADENLYCTSTVRFYLIQIMELGQAQMEVD